MFVGYPSSFEGNAPRLGDRPSEFFTKGPTCLEWLISAEKARILSLISSFHIKDIPISRMISLIMVDISMMSMRSSSSKVLQPPSNLRHSLIRSTSSALQAPRCGDAKMEGMGQMAKINKNRRINLE